MKPLLQKKNETIFFKRYLISCVGSVQLFRVHIFKTTAVLGESNLVSTVESRGSCVVETSFYAAVTPKKKQTNFFSKYLIIFVCNVQLFRCSYLQNDRSTWRIQSGVNLGILGILCSGVSRLILPKNMKFLIFFFLKFFFMSRC